MPFISKQKLKVVEDMYIIPDYPESTLNPIYLNEIIREIKQMLAELNLSLKEKLNLTQIIIIHNN